MMTTVRMMIMMMMMQGLNDMKTAVAEYKNVLHQDNMCIEAIACIATHHFYTDQPEIALNYYRSSTSPSIHIHCFITHSLGEPWLSY